MWRQEGNCIMLPVDLARISAQHVGILKPGQFFLHRELGATSLAMRLNEEAAWWVNFTGSKAFRLSALDHGRMTVLALGIEPERVKLRIDQTSTASNFTEHRIGQLLFDEEGKAGIAVVWGDDKDPQEYKNVVRLDGWHLDSIWQPRCIFDRWALSYLDEAGQWVDLVRREPPSA